MKLKNIILIFLLLVPCLVVSASPATHEHPYLAIGDNAMVFPGIQLVIQINHLINQSVLLQINHQANESLFIDDSPFYHIIQVPQQGNSFTVYLYLNNTLLDSLTIPIVQNGGIPITTTIIYLIMLISMVVIFLLFIIAKVSGFFNTTTNKICTQCHFANDANATYCEACGEKL